METATVIPEFRSHQREILYKWRDQLTVVSSPVSSRTAQCKGRQPKLQPAVAEAPDCNSKATKAGLQLPAAQCKTVFCLLHTACTSAPAFSRALAAGTSAQFISGVMPLSSLPSTITPRLTRVCTILALSQSVQWSKATRCSRLLCGGSACFTQLS
jgi:hypothetical protein